MFQLDPTEKIFSPRIDFVFKSIFTQNTRESKEALKDFLESTIGKKIDDIAIMENELPVTGVLEKQATMDLNCRFNDGDQANIEIQVRNRGNMGVRAEYHVCKLHGGQAIKGATYDDLHDTYQITIADYTVFPEDNLFFDEFVYRSKSGRTIKDGRTKIFFIELTKLQGILDKPEEQLTRPEMWALYFKYVDDTRKRDKINRMIAKEEGLAMASDMLRKLAKDDAARVTLLSLEKAQLDQSDLIYQARKEGIQEGSKEKEIEMIHALNKQGVDLNVIAAAARLPVDEVLEILNNQ